MNDWPDREVPDRNAPDEFTQVDLPEIGEETPHPQVPDPDAHQNAMGSDAKTASGTDAVNSEKIGFVP